MKSTLEICQDLIRFPSITPNDAGCQRYIADILQTLGFSHQSFPCNRVENLYAQFGNAKPLFVFAGHTDVVAVGDETAWKVPPFAGVVQNEQLIGRGVADMKGSIAAMITATREFLLKHPNPKASIGFLLTSAEEGDDYLDGTPYVLDELKKQNIKIDYCVLGEPSSSKQTGDTLRVGRRGSLSGTLTVLGKQGHVAFPELAHNPIPALADIMRDLSNEMWDEGNAFFPPTGFQITSIHADAGGRNIIPGKAEIQFNFRYSSASTAKELQARTIAIVDAHSHDYQLEWQLSGEPFLTHPGKLITSCENAIESVMGFKPIASTGGGTSDGRFISPRGIDVVECGPCNASIHQVNEAIEVSELASLHQIYYEILTTLCL